MHRVTWLSSIALLCSPILAWSQEPGSRIRITEIGSARAGRHTGTVVTAGADSVVLRLDHGGKTVAFPTTGLSQLEMSRGRRGHALTGALLGFLVGAGTGAVWGTSTCGACSGEDNDKAIAALLGAGVGGGIGLVVGAIAGSAWKTDRWEAVPLSGLRVSAWLPTPGRFGLALSLRF